MLDGALGRALPRGLRGGGRHPGRLPRRRLLRRRHDLHAGRAHRQRRLDDPGRPSRGRNPGRPAPHQRGRRASAWAPGSAEFVRGHRPHAGRAGHQLRTAPRGRWTTTPTGTSATGIAHFRVERQAAIDLATFDCVQSDACPLQRPADLRRPLAWYGSGAMDARDQLIADSPTSSRRPSRAGTPRRSAALLAPGFLHRTVGGGAVDAADLPARHPADPGRDPVGGRSTASPSTCGASRRSSPASSRPACILEGKEIEDRRGFVDWFVRQPEGWRLQLAVDFVV